MMKFNILIIFLIFAAFTSFSCESKIEMIPKSDILLYPTSSGKDIETVLTDSGKIKLILTAPLVERYDVKEGPYTEFTKGIKVIIYEGKEVPSGFITSKYAKYTNDDDTWVLKDSVIVINENNDKLETELLNWDQKKDFIYTDRFVKITTNTLIMQGFGFESDSHLNHRRIKKVSAEITLEDEE